MSRETDTVNTGKRGEYTHRRGLRDVQGNRWSHIITLTMKVTSPVVSRRYWWTHRN